MFHYRKCISVHQRLAITIRYLATGETFTSLHMQFRVGLSTISKLIPEVLESIWDCFVNIFFEG